MLHSQAAQLAPLLCAVVVSFPRSGTHFTLDFLRRNFAEFAFRPRLWESSETLYVNLDVRTAEEEALADAFRSRSGAPKPGRAHFAAADRANFLVKTHDLPFASRSLQQRLLTFTKNHVIAELYPFRRMSETAVSYHAHQNDHASIPDFLACRDPFLGTSSSVLQTMLDHGEWGLHNALPIDIEDMQLRPHAYGEALASHFGWTFAPPADPLPPKRIASGMMGEFIERFRGRASSEVVITAKRRPRSEAAYVDEDGPLADLYRALKHAALRPR